MGLGELKEKGSLLGHPQVHGGRQGVLKSRNLLNACISLRITTVIHIKRPYGQKALMPR